MKHGVRLRSGALVPLITINSDMQNPLNECRLEQIQPATRPNFSNYRTQVVLKMNSNCYVKMGFCRGEKDNYAVFIHIFKGGQYVGDLFPRDRELFTHILRIMTATHVTQAQFMSDFDMVYNHTSGKIDPMHDWVFFHLNDLVIDYTGYHWVAIMWAYLHLAMISEYMYTKKIGDHVFHSIMNKRMKFIGVAQVVLGLLTPYAAGEYSKGKPPRLLLNTYDQLLNQVRQLFAKK